MWIKVKEICRIQKLYVNIKDYQKFPAMPVPIYIIKQDIRIYVPYSRPNCWTDWAEIFRGHSGVAGG